MDPPPRTTISDMLPKFPPRSRSRQEMTELILMLLLFCACGRISTLNPQPCLQIWTLSASEAPRQTRRTYGHQSLGSTGLLFGMFLYLNTYTRDLVRSPLFSRRAPNKEHKIQQFVRTSQYGSSPGFHRYRLGQFPLLQ